MHQSIKQWSAGDQPREKLILMGSKSLSEAELLAILMRAGTRNKSALDVAKELLTQNDNSIAALAKLSVHELMKIKGIKVLGCVNSTLEYSDQHLVINGCSDLLHEIFGKEGDGYHARSALGFAQLPTGAAVEVEAIFEIKA